MLILTTMDNYHSHWDQLAERFNTHNKYRGGHQDATVNIHVGWPSFLHQINLQKRYLGIKSCTILDFGCGTGGFSGMLSSNGHRVVGVDKSKEMLKIAKGNITNKVLFLDTNSFFKSEKHKSSFDVITAMHVFDWIHNTESNVIKLDKYLRKGGIFLLSVFPKQHVIDSISIKDLFTEFNSSINPKIGYADFDGIKIKTYVRDPHYYERVFSKQGYEKVAEEVPPYPLKFLNTHGWKGSLQPEMVIMCFRKIR